MNSRITTVASLAVLAAGASGVVAGISTTSSAVSTQQPTLTRAPIAASAPSPTYQRTAEGLTFGNPAVDTPRSQMPDLVPVTGVAGRQGYLLIDDFLGNSVPAKSPADAVAQMKKIDPDGDGEIWQPVYAGDGKTVIDQFHSATITLDEPSAIDR